MSTKSLVPVVDKNGNPTRRWKNDEAPTTNSGARRLAKLVDADVAHAAPSDSSVTTLAGQPLPEVSFEHLYHVGTFVQDQKKAYSYEGQGLSVSRHPHVWRGLAQLSGDIWEFDVPENRFLDYHELSAEQRDELTRIALERGYIRPETMWVVRSWDDEMEEELEFFYSTQDEAEEEADGIDGRVEEVSTYVATDSFPDKTVTEGSVNFEQVLATIWVNENAPELDGVWWEDRLDALRYSAPRGVLSMNKIAEWTANARVIDDSEVVYDDDEDYYDEDDN